MASPYETLDPATIGAFQKMLGQPITNRWDPATDSAMRAHLQSRGLQYGYGINASPTEWEFLTATLRENEANPNPAVNDAAYQAFLRTSGLQEANIKNEIQSRIEATQRAINRAAAGYEQQKTDAVKGVNQDFEERGFYNSGARSTKGAEATAKVDYDRNTFESEQNEALQEANRRAQVQLGDIGARRAEEELAARGRITERRANQTYNPLGA